MLLSMVAVPSEGLPISTIIEVVVRYESLLSTLISIELSSSVTTESEIAVMSGSNSVAFMLWLVAT